MKSTEAIKLANLRKLQFIATKLGELCNEVICRWYYYDVILDVMPTDEKILGFGNRWHKAAIQQAVTYLLIDKLQ